MGGVLIKGSLVHYEILGRGKPIILLHGWLGSWRYWVPVMDELASEYRTYALDLWGFGDSDKVRQQYDLDGYVGLVLGFMDELGIWRAPLVGHTLGAAIAARLAADHPDRVDKVLAVGLPLGREAIHRKLLSAGPNEALARLFWHRQRPYGEVEMGAAKAAENVLARTVQSVADQDLRDVLEDVEVPFLSVYGDQDPVIDVSQAEGLDEDHYAVRSIILPGMKHFPMLDNTSTFTRLLRDFMDVRDPEALRQLSIKKEWRRRTR